MSSFHGKHVQPGSPVTPCRRPSGSAVTAASLHSAQVTYNIERCEKIGNEPIVAALRALDKFEVAVGGDSRIGGYTAVPASTGPDAALITSSMGTGLIESQPAVDGQLEVASPMSGALVASQGTPDGRLVPRGSPHGEGDVLEEVINYRVRTSRKQLGCRCVSVSCCHWSSRAEGLCILCQRDLCPRKRLEPAHGPCACVAYQSESWHPARGRH